MIGSTQQVGRVLFEQLGLTAGAQGQDGLLDRREGAARDPPRPRDRAGDRGVARALEAPEHVPRPAAVAALRGRRRGCTRRSTRRSPRPGRLSTSDPNLQSIPIRTELGREIRSAFVAEEGHRILSADYSQIELRILAHVSGEPKLREAFARGEDIHTATAAEVLGIEPAKLTSGAAVDREDDQLRDRLRDLRVRPVGEPRDPARRSAALHRRVPRALPARAGLHRAHDRAGGRATATSRRCSGGAAPCPSCARRTARRAASASASRSTSSCRARTPTSSRSR